MTKKLKYIVSILLVFILLIPMTIKLFDSAFHHHDHFVCTSKNINHFHKHHDTCPIPSFVLSAYSLHKIFHIDRETRCYERLTSDVLINYCRRSKYSFSL